jgi:hypothetical protein
VSIPAHRLPAGTTSAGVGVTPTQLAAAAETAPVELTGLNLAQYGAIGILLAAFIAFAFRAWQRECTRADRQEAEHRAERDRLLAEHRADRERLEGETRRLHGDIQEKAIPALLASATALTEVTELLREQQRDRRYDYARTPRREGEV